MLPVKASSLAMQYSDLGEGWTEHREARTEAEAERERERAPERSVCMCVGEGERDRLLDH